MTGQVPSLEDRSSSFRARTEVQSEDLIPRPGDLIPTFLSTRRTFCGGRKNQARAADRDHGLRVEKKERNVHLLLHFLALWSMVNYFCGPFILPFVSGHNDGTYLTELSWGLLVIARARHRARSQWMLVVVVIGRDGDCGTSWKTGKFQREIKSSPDNLGYRASEWEPHFFSTY